MPNNINVNGHIFGGWILSQMDIGGAILAKEITQSKVVTVHIEKVSFLKFIYSGDIIKCYAKCLKTGNSSLKISIKIWSKKINDNKNKKYLAAKGVFIYVAIDDLGNPNPVFLKKNKI
ncbi:hotdog domain-containing protein [Buchnera aphidicola]|uniref:hotdog domain-containing protein n=1 Tax=Buchnera aphidicola TaxID=9 RepID=UPI003CC85326